MEELSLAMFREMTNSPLLNVCAENTHVYFSPCSHPEDNLSIDIAPAKVSQISLIVPPYLISLRPGLCTYYNTAISLLIPNNNKYIELPEC